MLKDRIIPKDARPIGLVEKEFPELAIGQVSMIETEVVGLRAVERVAESLYVKPGD